jgi:hypothetical protein
VLPNQKVLQHCHRREKARGFEMREMRADDLYAGIFSRPRPSNMIVPWSGSYTRVMQLKRGLAGAVRANQPHDLALINVEGHAIESNNAAEVGLIYCRFLVEP